MTPQVRNWLWNAMHVFFGGGAGVLAMAAVAPNELNLDHPWRLIGAASILGIFALWQWLAKAKAPWEPPTGSVSLSVVQAHMDAQEEPKP